MKLVDQYWENSDPGSDMANEALPQHVFVSYSRADAEIAVAVVERLRSRHIPVWIDVQLNPGDHSYENTIREAIRNAFAFVLVASPDVIASRYVLGEVRLAQRQDVPIFPIWVAGAYWEESIHTDLIATQYIDLRGDSFESGAVLLCDRINQQIEKVFPRYLATPSRYESRRAALARLRAGQEHEALDKLFIKVYSGLNSMLFRYLAYGNILEFIDDVYDHLVLSHEPPMYGRGWFLAERCHHDHLGRLLVPWSWLTTKERYTPIAMHEPEWYGTPLPRLGVIPGSIWEVIGVEELEKLLDTKIVVGIAMRTIQAYGTFDSNLFRRGSMRGSYGYLAYLSEQGEYNNLAVADPRAINVTEYATVGVYMIRTYSGYRDHIANLHMRAIHELEGGIREFEF